MVAQQQVELGVSTVGNRKPGRQGVVVNNNNNGTLEHATTTILKRLEDHSQFFEQNEPYTLPSYELSGTTCVLPVDLLLLQNVLTNSFSFYFILLVG
jgi:hypothetical protein